MEMIMRSDFRRIFLTAFAAAAFSASAFAGFRTAQQVVMSDAQGLANGDLGYVHTRPDDVQYIGCLVAGDAGYCFARNLAGVDRSCWSDDARWVQAMAAVSGDSHVLFYWDAAGYCTYVSVKNGSTTVPK
jgi:hypothetical protein